MHSPSSLLLHCHIFAVDHHLEASRLGFDELRSGSWDGKDILHSVLATDGVNSPLGELGGRLGTSLGKSDILELWQRNRGALTVIIDQDGDRESLFGQGSCILLRRDSQRVCANMCR